MPRWTNADRTPLAVLRANAGLSRTKASVLLDIALNTLGRYEVGEGEVPLNIAEEMATLYKVPFDNIRNACAAVRKTKKSSLKLVKEDEKNDE